MPTEPNVLNYFIGKGIVSFEGRDLGNAPEVEITPTIEKLDHFSSRAGVRSKDRSIVLERGLQIRIVLEEITAENLRLLLMGSAVAGGSFDILAVDEIEGELTFEGTNDVGQKVSFTIPSVSFTPSGSLNLISDEWGSIEITGEILSTESSAGTSFGTITVEDAS